MNPLASLAAARRARDEGDPGTAGTGLLALAARRQAEKERGPRPLGAFLSTLPPELWAEAARFPPGEGVPRSLRGIPLAVKDNLCTPLLPTTCGSRVLEGYRSPYAATAWRRLCARGAILFGKTNLDEFAMGSSTEFSAFGPTRNPVDGSRVPGGSSGGSAAAVAAGIVPAALGSDTGGSVRQPAAFCGVVGLKPTWGRVSRFGLVAFASSLDTVGVLASRVEDAAELLEAIAGPDPRDATCGRVPLPRAGALPEVHLRGVSVALLRDALREAEPGVADATAAAAETLAAAGVRLREVALPHARLAVPCYVVLATAEASSNLARYDGARYGRGPRDAPRFEALVAATRERLGEEVRRRLVLGAFVLSAGWRERLYRHARRARARVSADYARLFEEGVDAVLGPTTPTPAFRLCERSAEDPWEMYRSDVFTAAANLAGLPAVSLPVGLSDGLPVGGQLVGPAWGEERLLGLAARLEERVGFRHPLAEPA